MPVKLGYSHLDNWKNSGSNLLVGAPMVYPLFYMHANIRSFGEPGFGLYSKLMFFPKNYQVIQDSVIDSVRGEAVAADYSTAIIGNPGDFVVSVNREGSIIIDGVRAGTPVKPWNDLKQGVEKFCSLQGRIINGVYSRYGQKLMTQLNSFLET